MAKGSSGVGDIPSGASVRVNITNEQKPSSEIVKALTQYKIMAAEAFPELKGQIYNEFNKLVEGDFSKSNILGVYVPSLKKIVIRRGLAKNLAKMKGTVSHELAHALSITPRNGFNSTTTAFKRAFAEYRRSHPRATQQSFARSISSYAATAKSEAFAEAFRDFTMNGKNASAASKLIMKHWRR